MNKIWIRLNCQSWWIFPGAGGHFLLPLLARSLAAAASAVEAQPGFSRGVNTFYKLYREGVLRTPFVFYRFLRRLFHFPRLSNRHSVPRPRCPPPVMRLTYFLCERKRTRVLLLATTLRKPLFERSLNDSALLSLALPVAVIEFCNLFLLRFNYVLYLIK